MIRLSCATLSFDGFGDVDFVNTFEVAPKVGFKHIEFNCWYPRTITPAKMADLKGMKLRAHSRTGVWLLEALGAAGIATPLGRIPPMLSKGVIDGTILPFEISPAVKMHELVSHFTQLSGDQPRLGTAVFSFLMNKKSYAKLPSDLKKIIDANSGRNIARATGENWMAIEKPGEKVMRSKAKNKFTKLSPAETAKVKVAAAPVIERWYREMSKLGHDGPALLADARAMVAKYSK